MELKVKAIVISSKDSGDKDKIVTLFCLNSGILQAKLKSVRAMNAKLKFAKEPFCFGEFILSSKNGFFTVVSAECVDSFYSISQNYQKFVEGAEILKIVKQVVLENQENNNLFVDTLQSMKILAYDNVQQNLVLVKYLLNLFYNEGYEISHYKCINCGNKLGESRFLDLNSGEVVCASCKTDYCLRISFSQSSLLRVISQTKFDKLKTITLSQNNLDNVLSILKKNLERKIS